jgi:hypothetical protein
MIDSVPGARHEVLPDADHESIVTDREHAARVAAIIRDVAGVTAGSPR